MAKSDRDALGQLFSRWQGVCFRVARHFCPGEAEDIVQDAMLAAMLHAAECRGDPGAWLVAITANTARMRIRQNGRKPLQALAYELPDQRPLPDHDAIASVRNALNRLPEHERHVLQLRYEDGLSPRLIAKTLGISGIATRVRLHRGLQRLRHSIANLDGALLGGCLLPAGMSDGLALHIADMARVGPTSQPKPLPAVNGWWTWAAAAALVLAGSFYAWHAWRPSPPPVGEAVHGDPISAPTVAQTLALVRPFRFYGDTLQQALEEIGRRIPEDMPLQYCVPADYDHAARDPGPGTDQRGLLFWIPQREGGIAGACSVREALDHVARSFGYTMTLCGKTAVLHRTLTREQILLAEQQDLSILQTDPQAWIAMAGKALDDVQVAERMSEAGITREILMQDLRWDMRYERRRFVADPILAGWPVPTATLRKARAMLADPTATLPRIELSLRLVAAAPQAGDPRLVQSVLSDPRFAGGPRTGDEPVDLARIFRHRSICWQFIADHPDPRLADWCLQEVLVSGKDGPRGMADSAIEHLAGEAYMGPMWAYSACGGDALALAGPPGDGAAGRGPGLASLSLSPRAEVGAALRAMLEDRTSTDRWTSALAVALARSDASAVGPALALDGSSGLAVESLGVLQRAAIRWATRGQRPALLRFTRTALLDHCWKGQQRQLQPDRYEAAWTMSVLAKQTPGLELWRDWIEMLGDPSLSDDQAACLVDGILQHRLDEADQALIARMTALPDARARKLAQAARRPEPLTIPVETLVRGWMEEATPEAANAAAIRIALDEGGRASWRYLRSVFTDPHQSAWRRGAALVGLAITPALHAEDIEHAVADQDGFVRAVGLWSKHHVMVRTGSLGVLTGLRLESFDDPDPRVRAYAAVCSRNGNNAETYLRLGMQLSHDPSPIVRQAAAIALAQGRGSTDYGENPETGRAALERGASTDPDRGTRALCDDLLRPRPRITEWPPAQPDHGTGSLRLFDFRIPCEKDPFGDPAATISINPPQWTAEAAEMPVLRLDG